MTCPLLRIVAATVASASGGVPKRCMCRRAMSANSAAVNIPNGATNSWDGRVHGAVDARSVYTPAEPALMSTVDASPVAIAAADLEHRGDAHAGVASATPARCAPGR